MNYLTLGGGAIACSAIVAYGWTHTPDGINACPGKLIESLTALLTEKTSEQRPKHCSSNHLIPTIATAPEQIRSNALQSNPLQDNARSTPLPNTVEQVYRQLLEQAHTAANRDRLAEAIASAASIPKNSQHYDMAQRLQEDWSQDLLQRASNCYQQANLSMAMTMLNAIPQKSQRYPRANELHDRWHQQSVVLNQAIAAKEVGDWNRVMTALKALEGTQLYQSAQVQALLQQATSNVFASDQTLLQLASASSSNAYAASPALNIHAASPLSIDPPQPSNLSIGVEQALEWARPASQSNISLPPKAPKQEGSAHPFADSSPIKSSVPVSR